MQDLLKDIQANITLLDRAIGEFKERGRNLAEKERKYRVALAQFISVQRSENKTPATLLADLARGDRDIATLRQDRDIAQSLYDSCKEAINVYKLKIRVIDSQIEREWTSGGKT